MSAAVRALHASRCGQCRGPIARGDTIVFYEDAPVHESCEPSPGPWEQEYGAPPLPHLVQLARVVDETNLLQAMLDADLDINAFSPDVERAIFKVERARAQLAALLPEREARDVAKERAHLHGLEQRIAEHERKAKEESHADHR